MTQSAKKRAAWCAALVLLLGALVYFNGFPPRQTAAVDPAAYASGAPVGFHPGEQIPDFTLTQTDGRDFVLSRQRGKVTVLNLWATWCAPCVKELPFFDRLQQAYPDTVQVLAIHSDLITDDVDAYLAGFDYRIPFAVDASGSVISALGGSVMLPQTAVLNRRGEVIYNQVGSLSYEALEQLVLSAMEDAP